MKIFVSTHPFGTTSSEPINIIKNNNFDYSMNSYGRKITTEELAKDIKDADILIAGTEKITEEVFLNAPNLKLISRVGIGLDGIDFDLCKKYGIKVSYTPDAPTLAVAELTLGLILDLSRQISSANENIKKGKWYRHMGMLLHGKTIGIIGMGRIGKSLIHLLSPFNMTIYVCEPNPDVAFINMHNIKLTDKETLLKNSDIVSLHLPLKSDTINYLSKYELSIMKNTAILINTSRGGIVNEEDLFHALSNNIISGAAIDVFENEPYEGPLKRLNNAILTCHMGASTIDSRTEMEVQALLEAVRFKKQIPLKNEVFHNE